MLVLSKTKSYVICTNWDFELAWGGGGLDIGYCCLDIIVWI